MPTELTKPQGSGADFNYTAYAQADFENRYYSSRLRIEKLDEETGESFAYVIQTVRYDDGKLKYTLCYNTDMELTEYYVK